jgi:hypothetical protein
MLAVSVAYSLCYCHCVLVCCALLHECCLAQGFFQLNFCSGGYLPMHAHQNLLINVVRCVLDSCSGLCIAIVSCVTLLQQHGHVGRDWASGIN